MTLLHESFMIFANICSKVVLSISNCGWLSICLILFLNIVPAGHLVLSSALGWRGLSTFTMIVWPVNLAGFTVYLAALNCKRMRGRYE